MSAVDLRIRDAAGERRVDPADLPLRVGTGTDCALRLPGPGGEPLALIDLLDGQPFVQPVGRQHTLEFNGDVLEASRRLQDGDSLQFFGSQVVVRRDTDGIVIEVRLEDSAYLTQPPQETASADAAADETIAPQAFRRAAETAAKTTRHESHALRWVIGGGLAVLLFASWALFTARSVNFDIDPGSPDAFAIEGGWFRLPIGDRVLLRRGSHTVKVAKDGYYDVAQTFVVGDEPSMTVRLKLRPRPGRLLVRVAEAGVDATVTVDGVHIGAAPYGPLELEPGEHTIEVVSERYLPFADKLRLDGLDRDEIVDVQLVPRWSNVEVVTEPAGATIFVGDKKLGVTPDTIELLEGQHELTVSKDGFAAWDGDVVAVPNVPQTVGPIALQAADAKLVVKTIPRGANVTVNGRYRGQSPLTLSLAPEVDYAIGLSKAGYGVTTRNLRLQSAASDSITVDLSARLGSVTVNVQPADATVYVDGRARGTGKTTVRLSSAPHRIEVKRKGFADWSRTVTPRPGYPQTLTASLQSLEAIRRASVAREMQTAAGQKMIRVEGGTFSLGSSRAEQGRRANEVIRPVTLSSPYWISAHEVTNKQFQLFRRNHDSGASVHVALAGDNNPVASVSWEDAVQYCNWLSKREGRTPAYRQQFGKWVAVYPFTDGYRLPTEAEWVWALRYAERPAPMKYAWGAKWPPPEGSGNFADKSARELVPSIVPNFDDGYASTAPVGSFKANALGIYDGGGNVAEWVNDWYTVPTPGITTPDVDPVGPPRGTSHVIRGSSWRHAGFTELRMSYRDYSNEARPDVGFRVARSLD